MACSRSTLADTLNALVENGRVVVTETRSALVVYQLQGNEAQSVIDCLGNDGWTDIQAEDDGGMIPKSMLAGSGPNIRVAASRPPLPQGIDAILTVSAFTSLLERKPSSSVIWVHGLQQAIETASTRYAPWGDNTAFTPFEALPSPERVVRSFGPDGPVAQIDRWLLRSPDTEVSDPALTPWKSRATLRLSAALAQEVEPDGRLLFRGPPPTRFAAIAEDIPKDPFSSLQRAARWVFENARELENRHALVAAEIARTSLRDGTLIDLANTLSVSLEGARIAYGFGVAQQSKDTLKTLGDLRKTVSDDAAKLSDTTRSLGTAVISAVFGNIGLLTARLTLPVGGTFVGPAAVLLGIALTIYVITVIFSGAHYICIQRDLRLNWRNQLYRFLGDVDYERMVDHPAKRAERAFWTTAICGLLITVLVLVAAIFVSIAKTPD